MEVRVNQYVDRYVSTVADQAGTLLLFLSASLLRSWRNHSPASGAEKQTELNEDVENTLFPLSSLFDSINMFLQISFY